MGGAEAGSVVCAVGEFEGGSEVGGAGEWIDGGAGGLGEVFRGGGGRMVEEVG